MRFGQGLRLDQLRKPLSQRHQLVLAGASGWGGFGLIALAVIGQQGGINTVGFGPFSLRQGGCAHLRGVGNRDGDLRLMHGLDQQPLVATGGFTHHMNVGYGFQLLAQLDQASGLISELGLAALQMQLQARFSHIYSGIDSNRYGLHSGDRVRTHPYVYELTVVADALATVRVWSTGRARFRLGYGLTKGHPRVERTRARHRPSVAKEGRPHFLAGARRAKSRRPCSNQAEVGRPLGLRSGHSKHSSLACRSTTARYARLRGTAGQGAPPRRGKGEMINHGRSQRIHIQTTCKGCEQRATLGAMARGLQLRRSCAIKHERHPATILPR